MQKFNKAALKYMLFFAFKYVYSYSIHMLNFDMEFIIGISIVLLELNFNWKWNGCNVIGSKSALILTTKNAWGGTNI